MPVALRPDRRFAARLCRALFLCAVSAGLVACGSGSSLSDSPTTDRSAPTDPTVAVLAAYRDMWASLVVAARTSDYQSPLLSEFATGEARTLFVQGLAGDQLHGIVTLGQPAIHPRVTSLTPAGNPTRATVADCFDDTHWVEYMTSGQRAKNAPGGRRTTTAELIKSAGTWKVSELDVGATRSC